MPKEDYSVHPGEILSDIIESRNLKLENLFSISSVEETYWRDLLEGRNRLDEEKALVLEDFTGVRSTVWLNAQMYYDKARQG